MAPKTKLPTIWQRESSGFVTDLGQDFRHPGSKKIRRARSKPVNISPARQMLMQEACAMRREAGEIEVICYLSGSRGLLGC